MTRNKYLIIARHFGWMFLSWIVSDDHIARWLLGANMVTRRALPPIFHFESVELAQFAEISIDVSLGYALH